MTIVIFILNDSVWLMFTKLICILQQGEPDPGRTLPWLSGVCHGVLGVPPRLREESSGAKGHREDSRIK